MLLLFSSLLKIFRYKTYAKNEYFVFSEATSFVTVNSVKSPSISLVASPAASPRANPITAARSPHTRSQSPQFYAGNNLFISFFLINEEINYYASMNKAKNL